MSLKRVQQELLNLSNLMTATKKVESESTGNKKGLWFAPKGLWNMELAMGIEPATG